jgi:hypothetical protein
VNNLSKSKIDGKEIMLNKHLEFFMNGNCRHIIKIDAGAYKQGIIKAEKTMMAY